MQTEIDYLNAEIKQLEQQYERYYSGFTVS